MAYTGKKIETKLYDVFTREEAIQNSTPAAVSDKTNTSTGYFDIPAGTTAERPATPNTGMLRFNTNLDQLEQYTSESGWQGISAPPTITATDVNSVDETASTQTVVITGQNFDATATASLVDYNGVTKTPTTSVRNSSSQITITYSGGDVLTSAVPEPLDVKVANGSGLSAILEDAINIDATPVWTTSSGSVGTVIEDVAMSSIAVVATDPEGSSVSYSLTGGALPAGTTLSSGGIITGTPNVNDTYNPSGVVHNFTVSASDGTGNSTPRAFSILRKWNDGITASTAATSASAIKSLTGTTTMGNYWIDLAGTPTQVWCDMSTDGGGWMAMWMTPAGSTSQTYRISANRSDGASSEFENYSLTYAQRSAMRARCSSTQTLVKRNGGWMRLNIYLWNSTTHSSGNFYFEQNCSIVTSNGTTDSSAEAGIISYNNATGGDFGIANSTNGIDHHSADYYLLNSSCANDYLYQYGSGYKVNTGLSGWSGATTSCANNDTNDMSLAVYMR